MLPRAAKGEGKFLWERKLAPLESGGSSLFWRVGRILRMMFFHSRIFFLGWQPKNFGNRDFLGRLLLDFIQNVLTKGQLSCI